VKALRDAVPRDRRASFDELVGRIYAGAPPARDSVLGRLQRAIADRRVVRLAYQSANRSAPADREVHPWTLAQRFGHWYLYGHDLARGKPLALRLDRIAEVTPLADRFEPPSEAELAKARLFSESFGEPVQLALGPKAAAWALGRPGHALVKEVPGGGAVVEVTGAGEAYAIRLALSLGGDARVIAPASARKAFAEAVRGTLQRYR
jgi:proteasome accessory factor C